ncbi:hypothetical protein IPG41_03465 [Candidatus Peregrinibacteria bacterium]|nr:MAG: hypothetical protein IPG41_03465 [Candidatus Peregrinibacteria bacterium]
MMAIDVENDVDGGGSSVRERIFLDPTDIAQISGLIRMLSNEASMPVTPQSVLPSAGLVVDLARVTPSHDNTLSTFLRVQCDFQGQPLTFPNYILACIPSESASLWRGPFASLLEALSMHFPDSSLGRPAGGSPQEYWTQVFDERFPIAAQVSSTDRALHDTLDSDALDKAAK